MLSTLATIAALVVTAPSSELFQRVQAAQKCRTQAENPSQMDCDFDLGSLHFEIAGAGSDDAGVAIYKADWDGEYFLKYGLQHGCFSVSWGSNAKRSPFEVVFVSPVTGGVYRDWPSCQRAGKGRGR
jgi:hypothetical protein